MAKRTKYQHLKNFKFYTTLELAILLKVSRSGVESLSNHGLEPTKREQRRWKFNGKDVKIYLKEKNNKFKVKTAPGEVYCPSCRASRRVNVDSIDLKLMGRKLGNNLVDQIMIYGKCIKCGNQCTQLSSANCIGIFLSYYPDYSGKVPSSSSKR